MKISELVLQLQQIQDVSGDIDVKVFDNYKSEFSNDGHIVDIADLCVDKDKLIIIH